MPQIKQVKYAPGAIRDLQRLRDFLRPKSLAAAERAGKVIINGAQILGHQPYLGRLIDGMPDGYREWLIDFGDSGYVASYRIDSDVVTILAVHHQNEAGY